MVTPSGPESRCQKEISSAEALPQPARAAIPPAAPRPPAPRRKERRPRRRCVAVEKVLLCFMCPPLRGGSKGRCGLRRRPSFPWAAVLASIYSVVNPGVKPPARLGACGTGHTDRSPRGGFEPAPPPDGARTSCRWRGLNPHRELSQRQRQEVRSLAVAPGCQPTPLPSAQSPPSALQAGAGHALHDLALEEHVQHHQREGGEDRAGLDVRVAEAEAALHGGEAHRDGHEV